jgi:hypothetical protein
MTNIYVFRGPNTFFLYGTGVKPKTHLRDLQTNYLQNIIADVNVTQTLVNIFLFAFFKNIEMKKLL